MAKKIPESFFKAEHVVFVGYSKRHAAFSRGVREAFEARGSKVHAVNPSSGDYDVKVYARPEDVPGSPELAVVITNKSRNPELLASLAAKGVKRVMFGSSASADADTLARCDELGMEGAIVCPLQAFGGGLHRFHGWVTGIPKVGVAS